MIKDAVDEITTFAKKLGFKVKVKRVAFSGGLGYQLQVAGLKIDVSSEYDYLVGQKRLSETYEVKKEILKCAF